MFHLKTRSIMTTLALAALVLVTPPQPASAAQKRDETREFVFIYSAADLRDAQSLRAMDDRLQRSVRRHCRAEANKGASVLTSMSCRRTLFREARRKLDARLSSLRNDGAIA